MIELRSNRLRESYPCAQKDLYEVLQLGLNEYMKRQPHFNEVSGIYTVLWGEEQLAALHSAILLPDYQAREGVHEVLRVQLLPLSKACLINWKYLEGHIYKAFPPEEHKALLEAAGRGYYRKASRDDWESVTALMVSGRNFMEENLIKLTAGGMPAQFKDNFITAQHNFKTGYERFKIADIETREVCDTKIAANNQLYKTVMAMFKDAQKIFHDNAEVRQLFVFKKLLANIKGGEK